MKLLLFIPVLAHCSMVQDQGIKIILDADTVNEVDDLYTMVRALIEPSWNIIALNATQWQSSQWAVDHVKKLGKTDKSFLNRLENHLVNLVATLSIDFIA